MDATAKSGAQPMSAFVFFYSYRLLMTLVMLPILMGFVIKAFINLNDSLTSRLERRRLSKIERQISRRRREDRHERTALDASCQELKGNSEGIICKCVLDFLHYVLISDSSTRRPSLFAQTVAEVILVVNSITAGGRNEDGDEDETFAEVVDHLSFFPYGHYLSQENIDCFSNDIPHPAREEVSPVSRPNNGQEQRYFAGISCLIMCHDFSGP
jgi:hypothetical protein